MALTENSFKLNKVSNTYVGSDVGDPFYISLIPLEKTIVFKAFLESIKIDTGKENEQVDEADKNNSVVIEHVGKYDINVSLNIPAGNAKEAYNNLAKIEELQRLSSPLSDDITKLKFDNGIKQPVFKVWYRNLISNGRPWVGNYPLNAEFSLIDKCGFPCFIDNVEFNPEVEFGFFKFDGHLFPKNIKLSLSLKYDAVLDRNRSSQTGAVIEGFKPDGNFGLFDFGLAPFGVRLCHEKVEEEESVNLKFSIPTVNQREFSTREVNDLSGFNPDSYLYISLPRHFGYSNPPRYVFIKGFLKEHKRGFQTNIPFTDSKVTEVGNVVDTSPVTFKSLEYNFSMDMPAKNLEEAKKNCAKIQYILRIFYKASSGFSFNDELTNEQINEQINLQITERIEGEDFVPTYREFVSNSFRTALVYYPNFIEAPGAASGLPNLGTSNPLQNPFTGPLEFDKRGIYLHFFEFGFDIDSTSGYFMDSSGRLFPKSMSLSFKFIDTSGDLIKNYNLIGGEYVHRRSDIPQIQEKEELFPFNRKTVKIGSNKPIVIDGGE